MAAISRQPPFLAAWRYGDYRLLWASTLGAYAGHWIEAVVVAWLVLELTDSPFLVGLQGACRFAAMFLGPFFGTVSDRYDRRRILISVQLTLAAASLVMAGLVLASRLEAWHLFAFTLVGSVGFTLNFSTLFVTASDIVKGDHLVSAISLLMFATGITTIFGPLLGGSALGLIGGAGCFALMAAGFLIAVAALLPMKATRPERAATHGSVWQNLLAGLRYIKNDEALLALILLAALANLLILPYRYTLIPIFARDVFGTGSGGFGQLLAAVGLGATLGSLAPGALPRRLSQARILMIISIVWPVLLMVVATIRTLPLSMLLLVAAGVAQGISMALIQSLLLMWSAAEMRGRVSGVRAFAISTLPLGNLITGAGASLWGAPVTLFAAGAGAVLLTVLIVLWATQLRDRHGGAGGSTR
ncbi:MAG: MFS transporter [Thermodesulfobacteriota bacterium]